MNREQYHQRVARKLKPVISVLLVVFLAGMAGTAGATPYTAADCSCGAIGLSLDGSYPSNAPENGYYALTCQYGGYANIPYAGKGAGVEFEIHKEKPDVALSEFQGRAAALPTSVPGSPGTLEFDRSDPARAVYSFKQQEGSKTRYSGTHVLLYKNSNYIFVYGLGFDAGDGRFVSMLNAAESCAKAVADAGAAGSAGRVSLEYYPYNEYNKSEIPADQGTRFTATVSGFGSSSLTYDWYVDGKKQVTDKLEPHVFTWVPPDDEWLKAGGHTVKVAVTDGKGGSAESQVGVTVVLPHAWLNVYEGGVTVNGREWPPGGRYILREGDLIATSKWLNPGVAELNYNDGAYVRIDPGTEVHIHSFSDNSIWIHNGDGYFWASEKHGRFIVETPTMGGAPKGTAFEVRVDGVNSSEVYVFDGVVSVTDTAGKKTVDLAAGRMTKVVNGSVPAEPVPFDTASHNRWWERYSPTDASLPPSRNVQANYPGVFGPKGAAVRAWEDAGKSPFPLLIVVIVPLLVIIIAIAAMRKYRRKQ